VPFGFVAAAVGERVYVLYVNPRSIISSS
jgi:hypothetical protein